MIPNTRFIELRKRLGPSQTDFAANVGVARSTIADIERGRIKVSKRVKNKIVEKFRDEAGYFDTEKIDISVELKQGVETGVKQGFDDFTMPEDQREIFKKHADRRIKELTATYHVSDIDKITLKLFEKQKVISEKVINSLLSENANYKLFRSSILAISNFEDMFNEITYSNLLNDLVRIQDMSRKYIDNETVADVKSAVVNDFHKFEPYISVLLDLAKAMEKFVTQVRDLEEVFDIDKADCNNYLSLLS